MPQEMNAFRAGFCDRLEGETWGQTWGDDQDLNEAYDRGRSFAEELFGE